MGKIVVVQGPTAVGKSAVAVEIAKHYGCKIISADSRQFYKEMAIGTAVPSIEEQQAAPHFFIQDRSITEPLSAGGFEVEASELISSILESEPDKKVAAVVVGGSGLYVDALLLGLDPLPSDEKVRTALNVEYNDNGIDSLLKELEELDPICYSQIERSNPQRVIRALEVCRVTGKPYSSLKTDKKVAKFDYTKIIVDLPREELYKRIDSRVDIMMTEGLEAEAKSVLKYRDYNALRTVGYSEMFDYFDGEITLPRAVELIKQHSRNYAKRQITWLRRESELPRFSPFEMDKIIKHIED